MIADEKILITGVTGVVAEPLARFLAANNEVWGVARFADDAAHEKERFSARTAPQLRGLSTRESLEGAGITTHALDLGDPDFDELPDDFTYVLHLAWMRADLAHLEDALRTNVEGPGLLLQHCRKAKAALVMSGMGVYSGNDDPWHAYTESDPVGRGATPYAPTSPASKLGVEAVARLCARAFDLRVVITRLNTAMGPQPCYPGVAIRAVLAGEVMEAPSDPTPHMPIHVEDMKVQLEALLDAAATPALITNWCGDDVTSVQEWVQDAAALSGRPGRVAVVAPPAGSPAGVLADPTRRRSITGPCTTSFEAEFRKLFERVTQAAGGGASDR